MIRSFGSATNTTKKKKKRPPPTTTGVLQNPSINTTEVVVAQKHHHRNDAMSQEDFVGLLNHLKGQDQLNADTQSSNQWTEPYTRHLARGFGRAALITHFPAYHFLNRKGCSCCCCSSGAATSPHQAFPPPAPPPPTTITSLPSKSSGPSLPPYPGRQQEQSQSIKRVRFSSDTKPGAPHCDENNNRQGNNDTLNAAYRTHHPVSYRQLPASKGRRRSSKANRRSHTLQRRSSMEDLLNTFRVDPARRRRSNLALTGEEFEKSIIPRLLLLANQEEYAGNDMLWVLQRYGFSTVSIMLKERAG